MTDGDPQYDPARVMLNGAAIALVSNLTSGMEARITAEIKAVEQRQSDRLDKAVGALTGDVDALEEWRATLEDARLIRLGQLSVFQALGRFVLRYDRVILGFGIGIAGAALVALKASGLL